MKISKDSVMRVARVKQLGHDNFQRMASKNLSQEPLILLPALWLSWQDGQEFLGCKQAKDIMNKMLIQNQMMQGKLRLCDREWENKRKSNRVMNAQKGCCISLPLPYTNSLLGN